MRPLLFVALAVGCEGEKLPPVAEEEGPLMCIETAPLRSSGRSPLAKLFVDGGDIETQQEQEEYLKQTFRDGVLESLWHAERDGWLEQEKKMWIRGGAADIVKEFERDRPRPKSLVLDEFFFHSPEERKRELERRERSTRD